MRARARTKNGDTKRRHADGASHDHHRQQSLIQLRQWRRYHYCCQQSATATAVVPTVAWHSFAQVSNACVANVSNATWVIIFIIIVITTAAMAAPNAWADRWMA